MPPHPSLPRILLGVDPFYQSTSDGTIYGNGYGSGRILWISCGETIADQFSMMFNSTPFMSVHESTTYSLHLGSLIRCLTSTWKEASTLPSHFELFSVSQSGLSQEVSHRIERKKTGETSVQSECDDADVDARLG
jgi:hypothetical protein